MKIREALDKIKVYGRAYFDEEDSVLYSNYTCGGFGLQFTGKELSVEFEAAPDTTPPPARGGAPALQQEVWPYAAVFLDGQEIPDQKLQIKNGSRITLFKSETPQRHFVRVVKLTENYRTALGLREIFVDGELERPEEKDREVIEFIGDSITCGFGNAAPDAGHEFMAAEEDGWETHGAIAARALGLEPRFICVSGISVARAPEFPDLYGMNELYPYADRIIEDRLSKRRGRGTAGYLPFDFAKKPARYVILNLGTNDANQIYFRKDKGRALAEFEKNYCDFLSDIRRLNGPDTVIVCALGCMDYYLFDSIRDIAERYRRETGDERVFTLKYNKMMNIGPDVGGCLHPSIYRHRLMAEDLIGFIRDLKL